MLLREDSSFGQEGQEVGSHHLGWALQSLSAEECPDPFWRLASEKQPRSEEVRWDKMLWKPSLGHGLMLSLHPCETACALRGFYGKDVFLPQ